MTSLLFKNIIFDFDGTIADTFDTVIKIINEDPGRFGIDGIDPAEIPRLKGLSVKYLIKEFNINLLKVPQFINIVLNELYLQTDKINPFPGIETLLLDLKSSGCDLGIVTSNSKKMVEKFLFKEDIHVFSYIHSERAIFGKHRAIKHMMDKFSLNPASTIYVGDEVRDIDAAKKAGIPVVSVSWGYNDYKALKLYDPDFLVNNVDQLREVILKSKG